MKTLASIACALLIVSCGTPGDVDLPDGYSGARLYEVFCSSCHGLRAHGDGPVSPFIKVPVPDLTRIAARHGGQFPAEEVYRIIDGQSPRPIHGPRNMPVWGYEFYGDASDDRVAHAQASDKIERLVAYLEAIQRTQ